MDTIFALASAAGKAGVSIIRISGPDALNVGAQLGATLQPHDRRLVRLADQEGALLDEAFAISFAENRSFTGEQVLELHLHGSPAIVSSVSELLALKGIRHAEAGEFTRRAMENGRLDLAQVEGLADLIDAETDSQRRQAVRVFKGALGDLSEGWRKKLVHCAALLEATIDFVDEDVPVDVYPEVIALLGEVKSELAHEAAGVSVRERLRDGFEVALVGPPNVGKSTLLNRLAGRDAAITSHIAGTTRDVIEVQMDLDGLPVTVLDTAGLRTSEDELEEIGIARGVLRAQAADVRVHLVLDLAAFPAKSEAGLDLFVLAKADTRQDNPDGLAVSGITGAGVDVLISEISNYLHGLVRSAGVATRTRHQKALLQSNEILENIIAVLNTGNVEVDLVAEDLRRAIRSLDSLIGRVDVENVLGEIFASFCIGK